MHFNAVFALFLLAAASLAESQEVIHFTWAFACQRGGESIKAIDYSRRVVQLHSGDKIKLHFRARSNCCLYVFLHDSQRDLYLLSRKDFGVQERQTTERGCTLPEGDNWFCLDRRGGVEVFYLIVSEHHLQRLETLLGRSPVQEAIHGGRSRVPRRQRVLDEIRSIIRQSSGLAETAQKPVTVAGEFRGITEELEVEGLEVEARSTYVRTIRLQH